jgi:radical SAM protein with 4Fe4S-binding SPASM domain
MNGDFVPQAPLSFFMELVSYCNLKCKMCFRNYDTKDKIKRYALPLEIIDNVAQQCKSLNIPSVEYGGGASECLLHPEIKTIIRKFIEAGAIDNIITTNGHKLSEDISIFLIDIGVERLHVSIDAATPETYKKIRGANYSVLEKNIFNFLRLRKERNAQLPFLRVSFVKQKDNIHEVDDFLNKWKDIADYIDFQDLLDLSTVNNLKQVECEGFYCPVPFQKIGIDYEGNILPCDPFHSRHLKLGDIKNMSLKEAWDSEKHRELIESHKLRRNFLVCRNCYGNRTYRK